MEGFLQLCKSPLSQVKDFILWNGGFEGDGRKKLGSNVRQQNSVRSLPTPALPLESTHRCSMDWSRNRTCTAFCRLEEQSLIRQDIRVPFARTYQDWCPLCALVQCIPTKQRTKQPQRSQRIHSSHKQTKHIFATFLWLHLVQFQSCLASAKCRGSYCKYRTDLKCQFNNALAPSSQSEQAGHRPGQAAVAYQHSCGISQIAKDHTSIQFIQMPTKHTSLASSSKTTSKTTCPTCSN